MGIAMTLEEQSILKAVQRMIEALRKKKNMGQATKEEIKQLDKLLKQSKRTPQDSPLSTR